jgi:hypothetical protein
VERAAMAESKEKLDGAGDALMGVKALMTESIHPFIL